MELLSGGEYHKLWVRWDVVLTIGIRSLGSGGLNRLDPFLMLDHFTYVLNFIVMPIAFAHDPLLLVPRPDQAS